MLDQTIESFDPNKVKNNFMNSAENPSPALLPTKTSRDDILREQIKAMFQKIKATSPFSGEDLKTPNNDANNVPKQ